MEPLTDNPPLWPLGVYFLATVGIVAGMLCVSYVLGQRTRDRVNLQPYESGIASTGSARVRLSAHFYLFAMFFVIFDLESVFLYTWAISVRELGWLAYGQVCIFVASLVAALVYLRRIGALDTTQ